MTAAPLIDFARIARLPSGPSLPHIAAQGRPRNRAGQVDDLDAAVCEALGLI